MRIHVLSDLHTEFAPFELPDTAADVLVLAGDVGTGMRGLEPARGWARDRLTVYVAGNHEYYREAIPRLTEKLRAAARESGVHFLEDEAVVLSGVGSWAARCGRTSTCSAPLWRPATPRGRQ
jgi:predicted phosphohydrolase